MELSSDEQLIQVEEALFESAVSGNVTAQIFWLCNRAPERWKRLNALSGDRPTETLSVDRQDQVAEKQAGGGRASGRWATWYFRADPND
jgi:hypothetical protein